MCCLCVQHETDLIPRAIPVVYSSTKQFCTAKTHYRFDARSHPLISDTVNNTLK